MANTRKQQPTQAGKPAQQAGGAPAQYGDQNARSARHDPRQPDSQHEVGRRDTGHAGQTGRGRSAPSK